MSRDKQRLSDYLSHIRGAIERIGRYTGDINEEVFLKNEMAQGAVIRNFEIIGEASHNIERDYPDFAAAHPELPLLPAYEMRNAGAHGYFSVDLELIWNTIHLNLPGLHQRVRELVDDLQRDDGSASLN